MSDTIIDFGTPEWDMVSHVFLDGELQTRVGTINFTQGCISRPYTGPCFRESHMKFENGYVYDVEEEHFILEVVCGEVIVDWNDQDVARNWMRKHAQ